MGDQLLKSSSGNREGRRMLERRCNRERVYVSARVGVGESHLYCAATSRARLTLESATSRVIDLKSYHGVSLLLLTKWPIIIRLLFCR